MKRKRIIAGLLILLIAVQLSAQEEDKPVVALVLAGGGALGFAHVGAIKVLEEEGIRPDIVIGASMGSIVGGLYCVGYSLVEMERIIAETYWREILLDSFDRRELSFEQKKRQSLYNLSFGIKDKKRVADAGLSHGQHVVELLDNLLSPYGVETDFDSLPIPFRAVASDLLTGEKIVYDEGDLKTVIRASMSVPSIFTPVSYRGRYVIDGGWTENLPTTVAADFGADIIIAVSLFSLGEDLEKLNTIGAVALQADLIRTREKNQKSLEAADLVISPDLTGYTMASFEKSVPLMALGYEAADDKRQEIRELADSLGKSSPRAAREVRDDLIRISRIRVEDNGGQEASEDIKEAVESQIGHLFYLSELRECLYGLYDKGEYNHVWYQLVSQKNGFYELVVDAPLKVRPREQFSSSVEFSRQIIESHISHFTLKTAYQRWFDDEKNNSASFELWFSEFPSLLLSLDHQLMGRTAHIRTGGYLMGEPQSFYEGDSLNSLYGLNRLGGFMNLERPFFRRLELSLGGYSEYNWMNHSLGDTSLTEESWQRYGLTGIISVDTLDRFITPESGLYGVLILDSSLDEKGDALGLTKAAAKLYLPLTDSLILIPRTEIQNLLWGKPHDIELPALGQAMEIHGYYPQELRGENVALFGLGLRLHIGSLPLGLGDDIYFQLAGNTATVWEDDVVETYSDFEFFSGAAVGIVVNFRIGELQLNTGMNEEGRWSTFLGLSTSPSFFGRFY